MHVCEFGHCYNVCVNVYENLALDVMCVFFSHKFSLYYYVRSFNVCMFFLLELNPSYNHQFGNFSQVIYNPS
jgi:hypothetical protein